MSLNTGQLGIRQIKGFSTSFPENLKELEKIENPRKREEEKRIFSEIQEK